MTKELVADRWVAQERYKVLNKQQKKKKQKTKTNKKQTALTFNQTIIKQNEGVSTQRNLRGNLLKRRIVCLKILWFCVVCANCKLQWWILP